MATRLRPGKQSRESFFSADADFTGFIFPGNADFSAAPANQSGGKPQLTVFKGDAWFKDATFEGFAGFVDTTFERNAWFMSATFKGYAGFKNTTLKENAGFGNTTFEGNAEFIQATFLRYSSFYKARFEKPASFHAIRSERGFTMERATFLKLPDFIQAHFAEAPRLDNVTFPRNTTDTTDKKDNQEQQARYRALKRLAIQGHDHKHELDFFAEELKLEPGFLAAAYGTLSDYGRSLWLPFQYWCRVVYVMMVVHIMANKSIMVDALKIGEEQINCTPLYSAFHLAYTKGLLVLGWAASQLTNKDYNCLYGYIPGSTESKEYNETGPLYLIEFLQTMQTVASAVLIFLFLLAMRNHFRIK